MKRKGYRYRLASIANCLPPKTPSRTIFGKSQHTKKRGSDVTESRPFIARNILQQIHGIGGNHQFLVGRNDNNLHL